MSDNGSAPHPIVLKLLVPNAFAGAIIGKQGANIKQLREESSAKVQIQESVPGHFERLVTVSGNYTDVQGAVSFVFDKVQEGLSPETLSSLSNQSNSANPEVQVKVLVPYNQIGSVIGKSGSVIKQIREESGTRIRISKEDPISPMLDRAAEVSGSLSQIVQAVNAIAQKLSESPVRASPAVSTMLPLSARGGLVNPALFHQNPLMQSPLGLAGVAAAAPATNVQQTHVPADLIGRVIGKSGTTIAQIRQISGSKIEIAETGPSENERTITMTGTQESNQIAHYLIAARIQMISLKDAMDILHTQTLALQNQPPPPVVYGATGSLAYAGARTAGARRSDDQKKGRPLNKQN
eukprot:GILI01000266.1.p2 GENE.GILI01000266.1~~GILI01000266.1.p2  ORF type:complete len:385 (+),score=144.43 GILI01000266.1:104-1156(+)